MVSETKQSLKDQKRLEYLENLYKEKIIEDEQKKEEQQQYQYGAQGNFLKKDKNRLSFVDNKRRLQSAYRAGGVNVCMPKQINSTVNSKLQINQMVGGEASNLGLVETDFPNNMKSNKNLNFINQRKNSNNGGLTACGNAATYAEQIANKYKEMRGMSAQGSRSIGRGLNNRSHYNYASSHAGGNRQGHHYSGTNIFSAHGQRSGGEQQKVSRQRQRTAQPNQRQKMIEKIRDVKQKEQTRLRETLMRFYNNDPNA